MIFQYDSKARKSKSYYFMSLKGIKSSWKYYKLRGLNYSKLTLSAIRRDGDNAIVVFRVAGV